MAQGNPLPSFQESQTLESYVTLLMRAGGLRRGVAVNVAAIYPMGIGLPTAMKVDLERAGLTEKQAERLAAMLSLCRYLGNDPYRTALRGPEDVVRYLRHALVHEEQESFVAVLLDARGRVIDIREVAKGSAAHVEVHPRELFRDAIRMRVHSMIVAHNHPSGDPDPSQADIELTKRLREVGALVGIPVMDHIIIGRTEAVSMANRGHF